MGDLMNRRDTMLGLLALGAVTGPLAALAQPASNARRIGFIRPSRAVVAAWGLDGVFETALRDLGWIEGRNVVYEYRWLEQQYESIPKIASELIGLNVDLIVSAAGGVTAALGIKKATSTIPILFVAVADPVKFGLVASFDHPGGNATGIAYPVINWGKWIELARDCVGTASRVALIANPANTTYADYIAQNEAAAQQLGVRLQILPVARAEELVAAFSAMKREHASALIFGPDTLYTAQLKEIIEMARTNRLPVIAPDRRAGELGALISFGTDFKYILRRAAAYADKILRGAKPADLPVEQPNKFELVVNMKTADTLGLTIPRSLLVQADEVIR